ncbi:MAG: ABC transporter ATP-binding protein, partial [Chloroflexota bacterium]
MIRCRHLQAGYGSVPILFDISIEVGDGERVALIGANGAGKTTSLRVLSGSLRLWGGALEMDGQSCRAFNAGQFVRAGITHVPEGRQLFSGMTVEQNLLMGAYARRDTRKDIRTDLEWIYEVFPELVERKRQLGGMLSGGQQQMVAIGRGLMARPKVLMLDELSLGLA